MKTPDSLPKSPPPYKSMQFAALLADGLRHCQQLGGDIWTDYNEHDPGVTILEQLCFAITELGLRVDLPMEDLLARPPSGAPALDHGVLPTGDMILGSAPLTVNDYRKVLYDQVSNLKNAWLEPVRGGPGGLYNVRVESYGNEASEDPGHEQRVRAKLQADVLETLHKNRNLGEDFASVEVLEPYPVRVEAVVDIGTGASATTVLAEIMYAIQDYLVPFPKVYPTAQAEGGTAPYDALYCGPTLDLGLIDDDQLQPLRSRVLAEEVAGVIGQVSGVTAVRAVHLGVRGASGASGAPVVVPDGHVPRLEPSIFLRLGGGQQAGRAGAAHGYPIVLRRDDAPVAIDPERVYRMLAAMKAATKQAVDLCEVRTKADPYRRAPAGIYRDLAAYYSIQHHFPANYGIGVLGAARPGARTANQFADVAQLKAYLLFFEQLLADFGAQTARSHELFSLADVSLDTYFFQELVTRARRPTEPPDVLEYDLFAAAPAPPERHLVYLTHPERDGAIALRSRDAAGAGEAERLRERILVCGAHRASYAPQALSNGEWLLVLADESGAPLAFSARRFPDPDAVEREIGELLYWLGQRPAQARAHFRVEPADVRAVRLLDDDRHTLLSAPCRSRGQQDACVAALRRFGARPECYQPRALDDGVYRLELWGEGALGPIMLGEERFASEADALSARTTLARLVRRCDEQLSRNPDASVPNLQRLPAAAPGGPLGGLEAYRDGLARLYRQMDQAAERRDRFLDHLLARVGERFDNAALSSADPRPFGERGALDGEMLRWKREFLREYQQLGGARGIARNYPRNAGADAADGVSQFERRLLCLLGMLGTGRRLDGHGAAPAAAPLPFYYRHVTGPLRKPALRPGRFVFANASPNAFQLLFKHGIEASRYHIKESHVGADVRFQWPDQSPGQGDVVFRAADRHAAKAAVDAIMRRFGSMPERAGLVYAGEDLLLVEHVLLRPVLADAQGVPAPQAAHWHEIDWDAMQWDLQPELARAFERAPAQVLRALSDQGRLRPQPMAGGGYRAELHGEHGQLWACGRHRHGSEQEALENGASLVRHVRVAAAGDAGFYDCRISVFFPDWPLRFQSPEFREFAENTVSENCPAHLAAGCYWVSGADMRSLRDASREWAQLLARSQARDEQGRADAGAGTAARELGRAAARLRHLVGRLARPR